ncbi:MAG TPA: hypothetical protein VMZ53_14520 [Kofleriaceae bacterium]|nr:hypothetical protein [Kofleriaceae bacterium]
MRRCVGVGTVLFSVMVAVACAEPEEPECTSSIAFDIHYLYVQATNATTRSGGSGSNWTCPQGGSATVTETSTTNNATQTNDSQLTFHMCSYVMNGFDIRLDGPLHAHNVSNIVGNLVYCNTCELTSPGLKIYGSELLCNADPIDATCEVSFTIKNESTQSMGDYAGSICSLTFP